MVQLKMKQNILLVIVLVCSLWNEAKCANILFVGPMPAHSHFSLTFKLAKEMADKGHQITFINPYPQKKPIKNLKDVSVEELVDFLEEIKKSLFSRNEGNHLANIQFLLQMTAGVTEQTLKNKRVQNLLRSNEKFDLVVIEHFFNEALVGLGYHFKAPVIMISPMGINSAINKFTGNPAPSSYIPSMMTTYSSHMTFWQRVKNVLFNNMMEVMFEWKAAPLQREIFKNYISSEVTLDEVLKNNISLVLSNSHVSISDPLPRVPAIVEIGGYHVNPPKKLPEDLQKFLDDSPEGVILFSMGSNLKSKDLQPEVRRAILRAFSKLKQKVLWKFETDLPEAPPNVKIQSWLPQQDVLAHPNIKGFISHGGLLSTIETIYHGVPIIGIPVFGDQEANIARGVNYGYAVKVPLTDITEEALSKALDEIINNPKYREVVKQRSKLMHDQPIKPIDLAVYWAEHVIRYKGAPHLRSASLDLTWYQREMIDVIGFLILLVFAGTTILYLSIKKVCSLLCKKKKKTSVSKNKKNK